MALPMTFLYNSLILRRYLDLRTNSCWSSTS